MPCKAKFSFLKGHCIGRIISHEFESSSTIAEMKCYLIATHNACDSDTHTLTFVCDEQMRKLTDDNETAASLGEMASITVSVIRKSSCSTSDVAPHRESVAFVRKASLADQNTQAQRPLDPAVNPVPAGTRTPIAPAAHDLHVGSRVRIEGLLAAPEMNGRRGVICEAFNAQSGRWTVDIDADGPRPACRGVFRPGNLRLSRNFSSEWEDEDGHVWPKNVDFTSQCPKGHALAPRDSCPALHASSALPSGWIEGFDDVSKRPFYKLQGVGKAVWERPGSQLMCRICRGLCSCSSAEAASWRMCAAVAGCCGNYAVCSSCSCSPALHKRVSVSSDDFRTMVSPPAS